MGNRGIYGLMISGLLLIAAVIYFQSHTEFKKPDEDFQVELDALVKEYDLPGATAAYILPNGQSGSASSGFSDVETQTPMSQKSRMLAASIGKSFVAATTIALVIEKKLDLDTPFSNWLGKRPWFSRLPNHNDITLRHLLTHSAGLSDHLYSEKFVQDLAKARHDLNNTPPPEKLVEYILDQPALFDAGAGWAYTDTGYILIGMIIEEVIDGTYEEELMARFINPLGMTSTEPSNKIELHSLAAGYTSTDNHFKLPVKSIDANGKMTWNPAIEWTGGGLITTPLDLTVWSKSLYDGLAMKGDYMPMLLQSVPVGGEGSGIRVGLGLAIYEKGPFGKTYGHGGALPGYVSSMRYYPEHGFGVSFQINTDVGITDGDPSAVKDMEARLAQIIFNAINQ